VVLVIRNYEFYENSGHIRNETPLYPARSVF
jgi:hypothetical protein